jgi:hypothetical protein
MTNLGGSMPLCGPILQSIWQPGDSLVSLDGEALAIHLLKAENIWASSRIFRLCLSLDDRGRRRRRRENQATDQFDYAKDLLRQKQTVYWLQGRVSQPSFIDDMWKAYHWDPKRGQ